MSSLFGPTFDLVESSMRFRVARQAVLSSNVAHSDTPGYRRFDLSFDELVANRAERLTRSDPRHMPAAGADGYTLERGEYGSRPDRNGVDLDQELITLSRNAGSFTEQAEVLSRLLSLRRIAVTGEPR